MVQAVRSAGSDHGEIVDMLRDMRVPVGHPQPALPMTRPLALGRHDGVVGGAGMAVKGRPKDSGMGCPAYFSSAGLGVEGVQMARTAPP